MPAGGTWTVQNKVRPGAYINFVSVPKPIGALGDRGVMTAALPMTWGPVGELISLTGADLINGNSLSKVGCTAFDTEESLPFRLCLAGCYKALLFRSDSGGIKASAILSINSLTAVAKYHGTTGNKLAITILQDTPRAGEFTVQVLFNGVVKEAFVVAELDDFKEIESVWVDFIVDETPDSTLVPVISAEWLEGGTNGAVSDDYSTYLDLVDTASWQCLAINTTTPTVAPVIKEKIKLLREQRGKKVQGVVYDAPQSDYEGIISVDQGYKISGEVITPDLFPLYVASITAGAAVNESLTAKVIEGAYEIINPVAEDKIAEAILNGRFLITYRQDGAVCIEKDINTLLSFTVDKNYVFSKNRVIRCLDEIGNNTALIFNRNYAGKQDNDEVGRNIYKTELISMIDQLVGIGAVTNFDGTDDIVIYQGQEIDSVVVDLTIQPVDSMEKLYMTVNVDA